MDKISLEDYDLANITEDEIRKINDLEQSISSSLRKDIILIAYQKKDPDIGRGGFKC
mgnify:FL=1|jgi:hypothetical protein